MPAVGYVVLTLEFRKEGRLWLGRCVELGTSTYGRSLDGVHRELAELVELHLSELEQIGEREHFFKKHGIRLYPNEPAVPHRINTDVPVDEASFFHAHRAPVGAPA